MISTASEITRKAKSNLAFALKTIPACRRHDMVVFYAFCRTMDDLADDSTHPSAERLHLLNAWEKGLIHGFQNPTAFQVEVRSLRDKASLPNDLLVAIIDGCRMDLQPQRYRTWVELSNYCWKVACAVGLVSIKLFKCQAPASDAYAVALGYALQLTNIIRDVRDDLENGNRIYLPLEDLALFNYTEDDLAAHIVDERFLALMDHQADRATAYFQEAQRLLPAQDFHALLPARIMGDIYQTLLEKMRADRFQVFHKRYRLTGARKFTILTKQLIAGSISNRHYPR
jgi:15-cis-phytoene synthase